jgi:hypothetical protein
MTALTSFFAECDRLDRTLRRRPTAYDEQAAAPNIRAAAAVAIACVTAFGMAAAVF